MNSAAMVEAGDAVSAKGAWGGARASAGRPKARWRTSVPHRRRKVLDARHPVHVTLRALGWRELRRRDGYRAARRVMARFLGRDDVRFIHVSIQRNHFHFLVEAASQAVLSAVMRTFVGQLARAINASFGVWGQVFPQRYHAVHITTPRQARNALAYVLGNWRRHREDVATARVRSYRLDPFASGCMFDGWTRTANVDAATQPEHPPWPVSSPQTRLLQSDWRRHGLIDPFSAPGPVGL